MSRTYHHGHKAKRKLFESTGKKLPRNHQRWHWMSTPSWWINEFMTRPQRQKVRQLVSKTFRLSDIEDAPEFPLAKKPHIYYW